jgi:hypothetical protein
MIAYHLDRSEQLQSDSTLNLIPTNANTSDTTISLYGLDKVSHWGKLCYDYFQHLISDIDVEKSFASSNSFSIDLQAESIRKQFFQNKPSRFKSIFAVKELNDFKLWERYFQINENSHIFEIEFDDSAYCEADASFLRGGIIQSSNPNQCALQIMDTLKKYWSGQMSENPLPELIVSLPVYIKRQLSPDEFIL